MRRCVYAILGSNQLLRAKKPKSAQRKNPTDTRYMKSSWQRPTACVPAGGALWSRFHAVLWPGGAKPAEVGPLVLNKAAPSAARYRPGEGTRRWERPHSTCHSPAHPQGQCFCPLACGLLQFNPGRLANLGWDSWFWTRRRPQRPDTGLGKELGAGSGPIANTTAQRIPRGSAFAL